MKAKAFLNCLAGVVLTGSLIPLAVYADGVPRIMSMRLEAPKGTTDSPQVILQIDNATGENAEDESGFDPALSWVKTENGLYRVLVEAENIELDKGFQHDTLALTQEFSGILPDIQSVSLFQYTENNMPKIRIALDSKRQFQPQIRSNSGAMITIALKGEDASVAAMPGTPSLYKPTDTHSTFFGDSPDLSIYGVVTNPRTDSEIRKAWVDFREGRLDSATQALSGYLTRNPENKPARYLYASALMAKNERAQATQELQKILEIDSGYLPALIDLVTLRIEAGEFDASETLIQKGLGLWPNQPDLLYSQGLLLEAKGQLDGARNSYMRALSMAPNNLFYRYRLATVELKSNHAKAAEWELQRILLTHPDHVEALKIMGFLSQRANQTGTALEYYQRALKPDAMINYAALLKKNRGGEKAVALLNAAELLAPDDRDIQFNLGMMYVDLKEAKAAERALNRFLILAGSAEAGDSRVQKAKDALRSMGPGASQSKR